MLGPSEELHRFGLVLERSRAMRRTIIESLGRPADRARREFLPARERAQLRHALRLHDLHYTVSRLIEQGANILLVYKVAGHADER